MKKILMVLGGGRPNGNTVQLANAFIRGAEEVGHKVETKDKGDGSFRLIFYTALTS